MNIDFERSIYKVAGSLLFHNMSNGIKRNTNSIGLLLSQKFVQRLDNKKFYIQKKLKEGHGNTFKRKINSLGQGPQIRIAVTLSPIPVILFPKHQWSFTEGRSGDKVMWKTLDLIGLWGHRASPHPRQLHC